MKTSVRTVHSEVRTTAAIAAVLIVVFCVAACHCLAAQNKPAVTWAALLDSATNNPALDANKELPLLAAAYRLTGDEAFRSRIIAQLEETLTWLTRRPATCRLSTGSAK